MWNSRRFVLRSLAMAGGIALAQPGHAAPGAGTSPSAAGRRRPSAISRPEAFERLLNEVPQNHWAYDALTQTALRGVAIGRPVAEVCGRPVLTRLQLAMATQTAAEAPDVGDLSPYSYFRVTRRGLGPSDVVPFSTYDIELLRKLSEEFSNELAMLGSDVEQQQRNLSVLGKRVRVREHLGDVVPLADPAYEQLLSLSRRGLAVRWAGTGLSGERALTRLELALAVRYAAVSAIRKYTDEPVIVDPDLSRSGRAARLLPVVREVGTRRHNLDAIGKLTTELEPELRLLGVDLAAQRDALDRCVRATQQAEAELAGHPVAGPEAVPVK